MDVVVTDAKGQPIHALRREDFLVREDGVLQQIVDFEAIGDAPAAPETEPVAGADAAAPSAAPALRASVALPASYLIVFDEPHLTLEEARTARAFVIELFKTVREGDRVTLVAGHDGRWWSGVGPKGAQEVAQQLELVNGRRDSARSDELMTPYEAMRIVNGDRHVEQVVRSRAEAEAGLNDPTSVQALGDQVPLRARAVYDDAMQHLRRLLDLVATSLELNPRQRGRTTLVLASGGFVDDSQLGEYRELVRRFVRTGVTAYFYDARDMAFGRGLGADTAGRMAGRSGRVVLGYERQRDEELRLQAEAIDGDAAGSMRLADETGGFTIRVSDATGLGRLASDARHYYLLGYAPTNKKRDGRLRRIAVEVRAKDASVRARKAYYAPIEKDARVATAPGAPATPPPGPAPRDDAASRYLALVGSHRKAPRTEDLDALARWPARTLRQAALAAGADPGCPLDCRRAAVLLHTDAAVGHLAADEAGAAKEQREIAAELLRPLRGSPEQADFERLWCHAMGDEELDHGRIPEAQQLFDALVKQYPEDAEARLARGRADEAGLFLLAHIARRSLVDEPELSSEAFAYNSHQRWRAGSPIVQGEEAYRRSAIAFYREALRLEPALVESQVRLGRVLWLDGKLDEAERLLAAVASGPSLDGRALAHLFLSRIADDRGRLTEALAHAQAAVEARPQWQSGRLTLADLQRRSGRIDEAALTVARALAVPDTRASEDGWLLYQLGAQDRATRELQALRAMLRP